MKKLLVIDGRISGTSTGRYLDKLVEYLHSLSPSIEVTVLAKKDRLDFFKQISPRFTVLETTHKEHSFAEQIGMLFQLNRLKPDLVHFPMVQQPILFRGKVVTTMQDLTTVRFRNPTKNWVVFTIKLVVYKWVNKIAAHKSSAIICPSEFVKDDVAKYTKTNSRKITVTYEAADKISDKPEPIESLLNIPYIMYLGRPMPHKNLYRLINAFVILKNKYPDLKLVLAGRKDELYREIEKWCEEQFIDNVIFTDFVSEGQLRWLYENCEAYIFPSLSEGFGLPALEAMAHGAPVVSSNATCLPEIYGDGAYYFDPINVDDIASKINDVLSNKALRTKLISAGQAQVKKYSWKRMAEQTLSVYESTL